MVSNFFSFLTNKNIKSSRISLFILRIFFSREKSNFRAESLLTLSKEFQSPVITPIGKLSTKESSIVRPDERKVRLGKVIECRGHVSDFSRATSLHLSSPFRSCKEGILSSCRCSWRANRRGRGTGPRGEERGLPCIKG